MPLRISEDLYARLINQEPDIEIDPSRSSTNAASRALGELFEQQLDGYHAELAHRGIATVRHNNPQAKLLGYGQASVGTKSGGKRTYTGTIAIITGKAETDYIAFLNGGIVVHFDAKVRAGDKFYMSAEKVAHQVEWLKTMRRHGCEAGLLVWWHEHSEYRWHSIDSWGERRRVDREDGTPCPAYEWAKLFVS